MISSIAEIVNEIGKWLGARVSLSFLDGAFSTLKPNRNPELQSAKGIFESSKYTTIPSWTGIVNIILWRPEIDHTENCLLTARWSSRVTFGKTKQLPSCSKKQRKARAS
jgi:hypothetical protein